MKFFRSAHRSHSRERAFSLIEMATSVAIIGILAGLAIPNFLGQRHDAQNRAAASNLRNLATAMAQDSAKNNYYERYSGTDSASLVAILPEVEPIFTYTDEASTGPRHMSINRIGDTTVVVAVRADSGRCWWARLELAARTFYDVDVDTSDGTCDASKIVDINDIDQTTFIDAAG